MATPLTNAGDLHEMVAFEVREEVDDGYGNTVGSWVEAFRLQARIMPLKGSEAVLAARLEGQQPVIITVRYSPRSLKITSDWKARDVRTGFEYAITSPPANMDESQKFIDIMAVRGEAA